MADEKPIERLNPADYDPSDEDQWRKLETQMDLYFGQQFRIFPELPGLTPLHLFSGLYKQNIAEWFPGDADLRRKIALLRKKLNYWFRLYVGGKRVLIAIFLLLTVILIDQQYMAKFIQTNDAISDILSYATPLGLWVRFTILVTFYAVIQTIMWKSYRDGVVSRCNRVSSDIQNRTVDLLAIYNLIPQHIRNGELRFEKLEDWTLQSNRYVAEMIWLAKRDEYIFKYMQVEAWSIGQNRRLWDAVGLLALIGVVGWFLHICWTVLDAPASTRIVVMAIWLGLSVASYVRWITPKHLLETSLQPSRWATFQNFRLHESIADVVATIERQGRIYRDQNKPDASSSRGPGHGGTPKAT